MIKETNQERANSCFAYDALHDKCTALTYDNIGKEQPCLKCKFHKTEQEFKEARAKSANKWVKVI